VVGRHGRSLVWRSGVSIVVGANRGTRGTDEVSKGDGLLVGDLVLPEQLHRLRLEDLLSCCWAGALIQNCCENLDVFLRLCEQPCTTGLEKLVLLVGAVLLQGMSVEVVAYPEFAGVWGTLVNLRKIGVYGGRRKHGCTGCIDIERREDVLFEVLPKLLAGDALEDYAGPIEIDLLHVSKSKYWVLTRELTPYSHIEPGWLTRRALRMSLTSPV
jgi:hypothetical protein